MGLEQGSDGYWRNTDDTSNQIGYATREQAEQAYGIGGGDGGSGAGWGSMSGLGGNIFGLAIAGIKLFIIFIKVGVVQSFLVSLGSCVFVGIFYGLITKTQFIASGTAYYITFAIIFTVSMIGWNVKKLRKIFVALVAICGIGLVYVVLATRILYVPIYMIPINLPEGYVAQEKSGSFTHSLNEAGDGVIIMRYTGRKSGNIVVPDEINGLPVIGIGEGVFREIKQVTLPASLKYIGERAFRGSPLTSIVIPEGVTDIGNEAFSNCAKLVSVALPESLKRTGHSVFKECASLVDVTIPPGSRIAHGFFGEKPETGNRIEWMGKYFKDDQGKNGYIDSFIRCPNLSDASKQAIRASGYKGGFLEPEERN
jgi:hypothetical protein